MSRKAEGHVDTAACEQETDEPHPESSFSIIFIIISAMPFECFRDLGIPAYRNAIL